MKSSINANVVFFINIDQTKISFSNLKLITPLTYRGIPVQRNKILHHYDK